MKRIKANKKGSVLITVVCITTVCMILVATALKLATYTHTESTKNVSKTQAQVMSEKYLQYFLSSDIFLVEDPATKQKVVSYDVLNDLAAATSQESPNIVDISLRDQSGLTNLQSDELGGTCKIYIYKNGEGIYVESVATYGGESMSSKAYFNGKVKKPYNSNNTIETTGGYTPTEAATLNGDTLIEYNKEVGGETYSADVYTAMHNNNNFYCGNHMTTGSYYIGGSKNASDTHITFKDSIQQKVSTKAIAPTITAYGNIIANGIIMTTEVGKIDYNGLRIGETGKGRDDKTKTFSYGASGLSNKDGYINCFGAFIQNGTGASASIGTSGHDIDVYCSVCVLGSGATLQNSSAAIRTAVQSATNAASMTGSPFELKWDTNPKLNLHGNLYVYRGTSPDSQPGDLFVNINSAATLVNGDMYVEGDIYLASTNKMTVTGNVYLSENSKIKTASGAVYDAKKFITDGKFSDDIAIACTSVQKLEKSSNPNSRDYQPGQNYAPGLFEYEKDDLAELSMPSTYLSSTPNDMYKDNSDDAKNIRTKYKNALETPLKGNAVYTDKTAYNGSFTNGKILQIDKSCVLTEDELLNSEFKLEVHIHGKNYTKGDAGYKGSKDIVVALPANYELHCQIRVVEEKEEGDIEGFVYFMLYDPNKYDPANPAGNGGSKSSLAEYTEDPKSAIASKTSYYGRDESYNESATFKVGGDARQRVYIADAALIGFDVNCGNVGTISSKRTSRSFILLADGMTLLYAANNGCAVQSLIYGPKATFDRGTFNGDQNTFFGQAKVREYVLRGNYSKSTAENIAPAAGSILEYINSKQKQNGTLKFHYYFRGE